MRIEQSKRRLQNFDFTTTGEAARTEALSGILALDGDDTIALLAKCVLDLRDQITQLRGELTAKPANGTSA